MRKNELTGNARVDATTCFRIINVKYLESFDLKNIHLMLHNIYKQKFHLGTMDGLVSINRVAYYKKMLSRKNELKCVILVLL